MVPLWSLYITFHSAFRNFFFLVHTSIHNKPINTLVINSEDQYSTSRLIHINQHFVHLASPYHV